MTSLSKELETPLAGLRSLPFIRNLRFLPASAPAHREYDGVVELTTAHGRSRLPVLIKRTWLNQSLVNAILGSAPPHKTHAHSKPPASKLVLARYIPPAAGEQLLNAGISFADDLGNIHLRLGSQYNWTVLGKREPAKLPEAHRTTPAAIQLLFQFVTDPQSATWTVRDLARASGISKTKIAQLRSRFLEERILRKASPFRVTTEIADRLVSGYAAILRPKLLLGRFRYPEATADAFLDRLSGIARTRKIAYALTGGPAAEAMQRFYHGPEVPLFLNAEAPALQSALRLLPDRAGPVILLKAFGEVVYWRQFEGRMVAPPWLVYAELLASADPRAREAAEELRREFLE